MPGHESRRAGPSDSGLLAKMPSFVMSQCRVVAAGQRGSERTWFQEWNPVRVGPDSYAGPFLAFEEIRVQGSRVELSFSLGAIYCMHVLAHQRVSRAPSLVTYDSSSSVQTQKTAKTQLLYSLISLRSFAVSETWDPSSKGPSWELSLLATFKTIPLTPTLPVTGAMLNVKFPASTIQGHVPISTSCTSPTIQV